MFSTKLTESINALDGGFITTPSTQEIVLQTFTGKVGEEGRGFNLHHDTVIKSLIQTYCANVFILTHDLSFR